MAMAMAMEPWLGVNKKDFALVPARAALGASMTFHGLSKLKEEGREQHAQMFGQLGLQPGKFWSMATGVAEVFAGVSALLGIGTRLAGVAVLVTQSVAIAKVHGDKGFDITKGGFEYNLALMAVALGMVLSGPGQLSAHEAAERLAEGRGTRRIFRRARPSVALQLLKWLK